MTREELIQKLQGLAPMSRRIDQLFNERQDAIQKYPQKPEFKVENLPTKIACLFLSLIVYQIIVTQIQRIEHLLKARGTIINQLFLPLWVVLIYVILIALINRQVNKRRQKENIEAEKQLESELTPLAEEISKTTDSIKTYCDGWWPVNYAYIEAVEECLNLVSTYRANTVQECINLYEQIQHQQRIEAQSNETLRLQMEINDAQQQLIQEQRIGNQNQQQLIQEQRIGNQNQQQLIQEQRIANSANSRGHEKTARALGEVEEQIYDIYKKQ